jgi:hypothetical protein
MSRSQPNELPHALSVKWSRSFWGASVVDATCPSCSFVNRYRTQTGGESAVCGSCGREFWIPKPKKHAPAPAPVLAPHAPRVPAADGRHTAPRAERPKAASNSRHRPAPKKQDEELPLGLKIRFGSWILYNLSPGMLSPHELTVKCPFCSTKIKLPRDQAGRPAACDCCHRRFRVPMASQAAQSRRAGSVSATVNTDNPQVTAQTAAVTGFSWCAVVGFVLALVSVPFNEIIVFPVLALVFSGIGLQQTDNGQLKGRGLTISGLVIGGLFFGLALLKLSGVYNPNMFR